MSAKKNAKKGTWGVRMMIHLFTVLVGILFFWLLGFLSQDIRSIEGPNYDQFYQNRADTKFNERLNLLNENLAPLSSEIKAKREEQAIHASGAKNMEQTLNQLNKLLSSTQDPAEKAQLTTNLNEFLVLQKQYQELNSTLTTLTSKRLEIEKEKAELQKKVSAQEKSLSEEWNKLQRRHRIKLAVLELLLLGILLVAVGFLLIRKRGTLTPISLAFGSAILIRIFLTMHEYFPSRWFKYILTVMALVAVIRLLIYFIKLATAPRPERIMLQYSQAYEKFLCPICEYPIRTGPLKFLYWNRKNVYNVLKNTGSQPSSKEAEPYTCPVCGEQLFEKCEHCGQIRHSLLQYCEHCGTSKEIKN